MDNTNLPPLFIERLAQLFLDQIEYQNAVDSMQKSRKIIIRINTLKSNRNEVIDELKKLNLHFSALPWYSDALILEEIESRNLTELSLYKEGKIYIQSLSSMIPALILNPDKNDKVLDIAAAPGSKTTQIAAMMNNSGEIIANDISRERLYKLKANLEHQGVTNVKTVSIPGQSIWQKYPEYFDKVLLDAPCSMEGRFQAEDAETYADWSMKKIKRLSKLQKWLLRSAVSSTKVGGTIVYSTCTLAPEENEEVINWILEKESKHIQLEEVHLENLHMKNGLTHWLKDSYSEELKKTKRILPTDTMEGFFVAKIKKTHSNVTAFK
jgi:16S rRNA (cytosine1407-C5)-methyltransferase